jgi:hypothetical protein
MSCLSVLIYICKFRDLKYLIVILFQNTRHDKEALVVRVNPKSADGKVPIVLRLYVFLLSLFYYRFLLIFDCI